MPQRSDLPGADPLVSGTFADRPGDGPSIADAIDPNVPPAADIGRDVDVAAFEGRRVGVVFWVSLSWIVLVVVLAALAPVLPLKSPSSTGAVCARCAPLDGALLGGDTLGRDVLSRAIWGARVSLSVGFMAIAFGFVVGGFLGVTAGYFRGKLESVIMTAIDSLLAFPPLVLALAIVTFVAESTASIVHVTLAIGVLAIAPLCRLVRASTLTFAQREFVLAAHTFGARRWRVIAREILPNVLIPALSYAAIAVAIAIIAEGSLAFLGLSVAPPTPTWGGMINEGRTVLREAPHVALVPSILMFLTVLSLNFVGDTLVARFSVREGKL